jgi:hypothetical protein
VKESSPAVVVKVDPDDGTVVEVDIPPAAVRTADLVTGGKVFAGPQFRVSAAEKNVGRFRSILKLAADDPFAKLRNGGDPLLHQP